MALHDLKFTLTTPAGAIDLEKVEAAALKAHGENGNWSLDQWRERYTDAAKFELGENERKAEANIALDLKLKVEAATVERLASTNTIADLEFEVDRRAFGSFGTTLHGADNVRSLYRRALKLARERAAAAPALVAAE